MLLTIPSVTKGTAATISLSKSELFQLAAVTADSYFSVQENVAVAIFEFDSDPGNQKEVLRFDLSQATPTASFLVSESARDSFLLERVVLVDFDGGILVIERSQLPSGLDVSLVNSANLLPVMSGLYSWFRGESLNLSNGAPVTTWLDESSSVGTANFIQDGSNSVPVFVQSGLNGLPSVRNTSSSYLKMLRRLPDSNTIFIVASCSDTATTGALYSEQPSVGSGTSPLAIYNQGGTLKGYHSFSSQSVQTTSIGSITNLPFIHAVTAVASTSFEHYLNGTLASAVSGNAMAIGSDIYATHDKTFLFNFFSWYFRGDIAEFIVFDRALTAQERGTMTQHLAAKYGITV